MLNIISSKNDSLIYTEIRKQKSKAGFTAQTQSVLLDEINSLAQNISIFGDKEVYTTSITRKEDLEKINKIFLEQLKNSEHLFFLVGSGAEFEKNIAENGGKIIKIEEKVVFDFPADMVKALQLHDRKNSWGLLMRELKNKDAEPVHGSCVFAYKSLLTYLQNTAKNSPQSGVKDFSWKQAGQNAKAGKREKREVIDKYFELVLNYHKARNGEGDLATQLEKWVLEN